jgi:hypothetical protein
MNGKPFIDYLPDWLEAIDLEAPENYRYRFAVATFRQLRELRNKLGPAVAYGEWVVTDRTGAEPERRIPCCRQAGVLGWQPAVEDAFPRLRERRTDQFTEWQGRRLYYFRFSVGCNTMEPYAPKSPAWCAEQAVKRRQKKLERECEQMPLLACQITEEAA